MGIKAIPEAVTVDRVENVQMGELKFEQKAQKFPKSPLPPTYSVNTYIQGARRIGTREETERSNQTKEESKHKSRKFIESKNLKFKVKFKWKK